jgi:tRNA(fMet)-specific endonuclease VapC
MIVYLLDTDTVSFVLKGNGLAGARLTSQMPSSVGISSLTLGELRFGAERRSSRKLHRLIDTFIIGVQVLPFDESCADAYGRIQASLEAKGRPIGAIDTLIAAHAFASGVTLVTNNEHFAKVPGLKLENWSA